MKNLRILSLIGLSSILYNCGGSNTTTETQQTATDTVKVEAPAAPTLADGTYAISKDESKVNWKGKKVTGEHYGTIGIEAGSVKLDSGRLSAGEITIDMKTIAVLDIPADKEENGKLKKHLESADFFDVAKFPKSTLKLTSVTQGNNSNEYTAKGLLTIKGIEKEISFPLTIQAVENNVLSAKGTITIDRTLYNVKYGSGKFFKNLGDKLIDDNFEISFEIKAKLNVQG
ncbi:MAG: YceI family protein [Cytophagales bacterium]|nr:YceI family protein [Cytophagales bacterium]MDW8384325.1 YceI family protein [Flammeovirgaceae bacterium]